MMGVPWTGRTSRDSHRNNMNEVSAQLKKAHGDDYIVFNLRCVAGGGPRCGDAVPPV